MFISRSKLDAKPLAKTIHDIVGEHLVHVLKQYCVAGLPPGYRASLVREGLAQQDVSKLRVSIWVNPANTVEMDNYPSHPDQLVFRSDPFWNLPGFFIGGEQLWRRTFEVVIEAFFAKTRESRGEAFHKAMVVYSRAMQAILRHSELYLQDVFGETALRVYPIRSFAFESGGANAHRWTMRIILSAYGQKTALP